MSERLLKLVETLGDVRILVVGELILDRYVWGKVGRVSPEAPIPVLHVTSREERLGGAGCVVNNLVTFGAKVSVCSVLGADANGEVVAKKLAALGVDTEGLTLEPGRDTIVKTRMIGFVQSANRAAQHIMRMDEETVKPPADETASRMRLFLQANCAKFDALLISDYDKGLINEELVGVVVEAAGGAVPVIVDPRRSKDYSLYHGVTAVTPNRYEAAFATGIECDTFDGLKAAGKKLLEQLGIGEVAITIDKDGIYLCRATGECIHFEVPARAVKSVYDVTGAGDMIISAFGLGLAAHLTVEDALALANVAAGIEVTKLGAAPVSRHELFEALSGAPMTPESKLRERCEITAIAQAHRSAAETIVFTNGCFDVLHPGHVDFLQFARSQGDVLIVGLNSDSSVRALKGEGRPVMAQSDRAALLGALEAVTHVVLFDEETPGSLVEEVRPDVLVKGEDWREKGVVGREFVESYGGRVVLAKLKEGYSTTDILNKIKNLKEDN